MLSADKNLQDQESACSINNVDCVEHASESAELKSDINIKTSYDAICGDSFTTNSDAAKAAVDKETLLPMTHVDSWSTHEVFDSSRRARWLSGISCTSSSTSGGEESPLSAGNRSISKQHQGLTLTPVNGWSDSTSTPSRPVLKEENEVAQRSWFPDGIGNISDTHTVHVDGFLSHRSPSNINPGVGLSRVASMERLYAGVGHDNRSWLSSSISPQSRWNSGVQMSEPFWATRAAPFHPQSEGMSSPVHSLQIAASQTAAVPAGCGFDVSHAPSSLNGSSGDSTNSMQMSPNVSPSTSLAPPSSKKRVCVSFMFFTNYCPLLVAQLVECWTCDQQVVGSNPTRGKAV